MRKTIVLLSVLSSPVWAQQQQGGIAANAGVSSAKAVWMIPHGFVARALEQTPDSLLGFKPTADVRTLGQLFGHIADAEFALCAMSLGEPMRAREASIEATKHTRAELAQALKESAAYCDKAYSQTDMQAQTPANFFGTQTNRMFILNMNGAHDYEHYGNIVTYLRLKGITPPSSQR